MSVGEWVCLAYGQVCDKSRGKGFGTCCFYLLYERTSNDTFNTLYMRISIIVLSSYIYNVCIHTCVLHICLLVMNVKCYTRVFFFVVMLIQSWCA